MMVKAVDHRKMLRGGGGFGGVPVTSSNLSFTHSHLRSDENDATIQCLKGNEASREHFRRWLSAFQ